MQKIPYLKLTPNSNNILKLSKPERFECTVYDFMLGVAEQRTMWIRFHNIDGYPIYRNLVFVGMYFMEGPTTWLGANFNVASEEECLMVLDILKYTSNVPKESKQEILDEHRLLYVDSVVPGYRIRFLVRHVYVTNEIPPHFRTD